MLFYVNAQPISFVGAQNLRIAQGTGIKFGRKNHGSRYYWSCQTATASFIATGFN
jgi:hypothetical protein